VTKTASVAQAMPGAPVVWTITVRNGGTAIMSNVTIQDSVPDMLTLGTSATTRGTLVTAGQIITVTTGVMNPGDTVTITVNTTISATAVAPATITNTACAARDGGTQKCATGSVTLGPGATTLPSTGIRSSSGGLPPVGLVFFAALMVLMSAQVSRRRAWIAILFVVISLVVVAGAVLALALNGNDKDQEKPTQEVQVAATDTPVETAVAVTGETPAVVATEEVQPVMTQGPGELVMQFPPTPTPYVVPTQSDVRYLMIPKLGDQFKVPIPIVELPLVDQQWDVSGLGYYIGWLQGTTWLDPHWGNTVLVAHVQLGFDNPGPFWGLGELQPGDEIVVSEGDQVRHFKVMSTEKVDPSDVSVTAPTAGPMLTLITCTEWDNNYGVFSQRMVVKAVPSDQS
jgi:sortase A